MDSSQQNLQGFLKDTSFARFIWNSQSFQGVESERCFVLSFVSFVIIKAYYCRRWLLSQRPIKAPPPVSEAPPSRLWFSRSPSRSAASADRSRPCWRGASVSFEGSPAMFNKLFGKPRQETNALATLDKMNEVLCFTLSHAIFICYPHHPRGLISSSILRPCFLSCRGDFLRKVLGVTVVMFPQTTAQTLEMLEKKEKVLLKKAATEVERAKEFTRAKNKRGRPLNHIHLWLYHTSELRVLGCAHPGDIIITLCHYYFTLNRTICSYFYTVARLYCNYMSLLSWTIQPSFEVVPNYLMPECEPVYAARSIRSYQILACGRW